MKNIELFANRTTSVRVFTKNQPDAAAQTRCSVSDIMGLSLT